MTMRTCIDQKDEIRKNKSEGTKSIQILRAKRPNAPSNRYTIKYVCMYVYIVGIKTAGKGRGQMNSKD